MNVEIEWHGDQFNINLSNKGKDAFLSIKGCRLVDGDNGPFVGYPATKNATSGKWWRHAWGSDEFNAVVIEKAIATQPSQRPRRQQNDRPARQHEGMDDDIPFMDPLKKRAYCLAV